MRFSDFRIGSRIYAGFAAVIAVAAAVATVGFVGLSNIDREVGKFVSVSGNTVRNLRVQQAAERMRGDVFRYRFTEDEASVEEFVAQQRAAITFLEAAGRATISEQRRALYASAATTFGDGRKAFDQMVEIGGEIAAARGRLFSGGDALTAATDKLSAGAASLDDVKVRAEATSVVRAMLLVRVANWRFLATRDPQGPATFKTDAAAADAALVALEKDEGAASLRNAIVLVKAALQDYAANFSAVSTAMTQAEEHYQNTVQPIFARIGEDGEAAQRSLDDDLAATQRRTSATVTRTMELQGALAAIGIILGFAFAFATGRSISRPMTAMTAAMRRLAGGDISVDVPARQRNDEIGEMAKAFEVFKQSMRAEEQRRGLEAQLQHSQRLEALGTLAGGVAHDINNTLVPVLLLSKLAMKQLPAESREYANMATILHAGERARDLVRQILAFTRKEAPTRRLVDVVALLRESLKMVRSSIQSTITFEEAIEEVPLVRGDPSQIHQVVINLIVNAAQAIGAAMGTISVRLALDAAVTLAENPDAAARPAIRLTVRDTGSGMEEDTMRRIFEPFFTTKPVGEGTGLGLSVVHSIVAQHGGRMTVESRLGAGTVFDVFLPAAAEMSVPAAADAAA
jgi:putative cofactor-binding repeat protein